jgi:hypothetical protein
MPLRDVARCVIAVLVTGMSLQDVIDVPVTGMKREYNSEDSRVHIARFKDCRLVYNKLD